MTPPLSLSSGRWFRWMEIETRWEIRRSWTPRPPPPPLVSSVSVDQGRQGSSNVTRQGEHGWSLRRADDGCCFGQIGQSFDTTLRSPRRLGQGYLCKGDWWGCSSDKADGALRDELTERAGGLLGSIPLSRYKSFWAIIVKVGHSSESGPRSESGP